ncbi:MAG: zinc metalloprotease HtpX [Candidatus Zambryskibacteria bacterium RIFCSPHIGHO2_01_FULL_43_27]|uniref:Protease HtpX homolog n=2 Tax=Patescibacteria group TaxID=1783273 RepID=A0A1G2U225_9BACT|nr:MAG: zinc metalloprotease HtpX [Candidatus Zambryskibacteria bacterium RIFCSPHIGHO2_01_FULL_43_27]OHB02882.1 MAG: zinc metalloprotease HtpX [Candidatus Zambryskibacteria bacterium RIFCSPLOWO2_01_FULL_43_17]
MKTWVFMSLFFVLIILLGWVFSRIYGNPAILVGFVIFSIILNITSFWYSDKIVLKLHRAKLATREEYFDLWNITENLSITAGLPMPKLYIVDDSAPNAFATGRDKEHAVVAVTTGLLLILERNELEGVIAHELSHIGNRDILLSTIVVVLAGFVTLLSDFFLRTAHWGGGRNNNGKGGQIQGILFLAGIVLAVLSPIIASLIQFAISRKREFLADSSGVLLTRYPEGLANALRKISSTPIIMRTANHATAHLFISNPFGSGKNIRGFLTKMFSTHPPVEERVHALLGNND